MALSGWDASSIYLSKTSGLVSAYPVTISAWIRSPDWSAVGVRVVAQIYEAGGDYFSLQVASSGNALDALSFDATGPSSSSATSAAMSNDTWYHAAATFVSDTERSVFLDATKTTDTTSVTVVPGNFDNMRVGPVFVGSTTPNHLLADVAVWSVELSDNEINQLANGVTPPLIQSSSLVDYVPGVRQTGAFIGGLSETGSITVSDHPPLLNATPF